MLLAASLLVVLGQTTLATAATIRTAGWPGHWANPITGEGGGSVPVTTNFGAFSLGCSNADRSNDYTYYLTSGYSAHLALDIARGEGQAVYSIGPGTVIYSGRKWGDSNRDVVLVEHTSPSGTFVATSGT